MSTNWTSVAAREFELNKYLLWIKIILCCLSVAANPFTYFAISHKTLDGNTKMSIHFEWKQSAHKL